MLMAGVLLLLLPAAIWTAPRDPLVLGVHPYLTATELHEKFAPLANYLSRRLGRPVTLDIAPDYDVHLERIAAGAVDFAYVGPAPYLVLTERFGPMRLLARLEVEGRAVYHGYIVCRQDAPVMTLAELAGHAFAFGDRRSTMSHVVPRVMLEQAGVPVEALSRHAFLQNHTNVAYAILTGSYTAGALKEEAYVQFRDRGLRVLAKSPPVPTHLFVASPQLDQPTVNALRSAMMASKPSDGVRDIRKGATALIHVADGDYEPLRQLLRSVPVQVGGHDGE